MKECKILKDFKGSPDGRECVQYTASEDPVMLTDSLAKTAIAEGWAGPFDREAAEKAKAKAEKAAKKEAEAKA